MRTKVQQQSMESLIGTLEAGRQYNRDQEQRRHNQRIECIETKKVRMEIQKLFFSLRDNQEEYQFVP